MALAAGIALLPLCSSAESGGKEYLLGGSGTNIPLTQLLVKEFGKSHPEHALKVLSSISSAGGIKAAHKDRIQLGLSGRPFKDIERTWNLKYPPYAKTPLVLGVYPSVPDESVSTDEVLAIYAGKKTKWKDGSGIVVVLREEGDNGADILANALSGFKPILENAWRSGIWRTEYKDEDCNKTIERIKGAFG
jgi:phosphate transport system substrate-binding protein